MQFLLPVLAMATFTASLSTRSLDPVLTQVASDLLITVPTAALAASAFSFSSGMAQPVLGIAGDVLGKSRVICLCLVLVSLSSIMGALAPSFEVLLISRTIGGIGVGGVVPVAYSLVGDLFPVAERQVALSRVSAGTMTGMMLGATFAGITAEYVDWRAVLLLTGVVVAAAAAAVFWGFRDMPAPPRRDVNVNMLLQTYRGIFAHPHARICFTAVFIEGIFIFGFSPFVSTLLADLGQPQLTVAGLAVAAFSVGALGYTFAVSKLLALLKEKGCLLVGGLLVCSQFLAMAAGLPWQAYFVSLLIMGFGFYMMHGCFQTFVSEISPETRGAALSLHACSMFIGTAVGPIYFGFGLTHFGKFPTLVFAGVIVLVMSFVCSRVLRHQTPEAVAN